MQWYSPFQEAITVDVFEAWNIVEGQMAPSWSHENMGNTEPEQDEHPTCGEI